MGQLSLANPCGLVRTGVKVDISPMVL